MIAIDNKNPLWNSFIDDLKVVLGNVDVPVAGWPANKLLGTDENGNVVTKEPSFSTESVPGGDTLFPVETSNLFVTPQMFGAVGDGVSDDTDAVQAALDNGGLIYFPAGRYKTTRLLTASKSCRIEMFKPYPQTYKKEYPLTPEDNWMGARIDTYSPNGGMVIGDGVEVDGLFIKAFNGFAGVVLKFDNTIGAYTYPAAARLKHIKLEIDPDSYDSIYPESMFDFTPDGSYHYILEDIVIGRGGYCEYGFRSDLAQTPRKWCNNVTIRNLCIDMYAKYHLYVANEGGLMAGYWLFDMLSVQAYTIGDAIDLVTLKDLEYVTFINAHIWDIKPESYSGKIINAENLTNVSVMGSDSHFSELESYYTSWMKRPENLNLTNLEMTVADNADNTANILKLSDGTNIKTVDIPKVKMTDEQIGSAISTWMDVNAQPREEAGRNKFDYNADGCILAMFNVNNKQMITAEQNPSVLNWVTDYIEARAGDVVRVSYNNASSIPFKIACYNDSNEIIEVMQGFVYNDKNGIEIVAEGTVAVRFEIAKNTCEYEERANAKLCITVNNADVTYEDYYTELVGGIGSFMALQSPNGTKFTLAVNDDGTLYAVQA
ncbi:MAG: glycosyl hydrolase family 28-related protein [Paludibacteraceae bacterium]|nr:glycosyl hydrolase family 28-related protein [Paludibacteraceae bacterium]